MILNIVNLIVGIITTADIRSKVYSDKNCISSGRFAAQIVSTS